MIKELRKYKRYDRALEVQIKVKYLTEKSYLVLLFCGFRVFWLLGISWFCGEMLQFNLVFLCSWVNSVLGFFNLVFLSVLSLIGK